MKTALLAKALIMVIGSTVWGAASAAPFNGIHPLQSDRFYVGLGGFYSDTDGQYTLDDPDGDGGTDVDLGDLGITKSNTLPSAAFVWRLSNNHRIQAEYFSVGQSTKKTVTKQIEWGDLEFEAGASIKSDMGMDIARAFYGYSFLKDDKKEFGAGIGLHYLSLDTSLSGDATINDTPFIDAERGFDDWAILPNIGAYANYAFSPKWLISGRIDWISANIGDYEGGLWNTEAAIQYQAFNNFGIGVAYRYVAFDLTADKSDGDWKADLQYSGPLMFLTVNF